MTPASLTRGAPARVQRRAGQKPHTARRAPRAAAVALALLLRSRAYEFHDDLCCVLCLGVSSRGRRRAGATPVPVRAARSAH